MRTLFLSLVFILSVGLSNSQTRQTIANGLATNPLIWNCTCIPQPGDVIVVAHQLTLNTDFGYTTGSLTVNSGASITGDIATRNLAVAGGSFVNNGTVTIGNLYHGGGSFTNAGTITVGNSFGSDLMAVTQNNGALNVNDSLYINTNATINNNGTLNAVVNAMAGTLVNAGTYSGDDIWTTGTLTHNSGSFVIDNLYNGGTVTANAPMTISNDLWNAENVDINHDLVIGHSLYVGDSLGGPATFNNDGVISIAVDFANSKTVSGTGRFCIGQSTTNSGSITGTLDVCDLTGGGIDFNSGTIAGTVTFCATSCGVGVGEMEEEMVSVVPNPNSGIFEIRASRSGIYTLDVVNQMGQTVLSTQFTGKRISIDGSHLAAGLYFYRLISANDSVATGQIIRE